MNTIIDISGLPNEYNELVKEFVGLLRKRDDKYSEPQKLDNNLRCKTLKFI